MSSYDISRSGIAHFDFDIQVPQQDDQVHSLEFCYDRLRTLVELILIVATVIIGDYKT